MRRAFALILPVLVASTGCLWNGPLGLLEDAGPPNGDRDSTLEYWGKLHGVMSVRSKSDDLRALTNIVQKQIDVIRETPTEGVDPELVAAAEALAKSQEKVIEVAEIADFQMAGLRASPVAAREFGLANQHASAAAARLAHLGPKLSSRYSVPFTPFNK